MKHRVLIARLATMLVIAAIPAAQSAGLSLSGGFDYSTGNYGTNTTTEILSLPLIGKYSTGPWTFKLTLPYLQITGNGGVVPGMGNVRAKGARKSVQSGLGDIVAAATYNLHPDHDIEMDLTGKIKFATAQANLGSGENDYAAQIDIYRNVDDFTAMGSLGVRMLGSPAGTTLDSVIYGSLGGVYQFTQQASGGLDLSLAQSPSAATSGQQEISAYLTYRIDRHRKAQGYLLKGFSSGSPDSGIGVLLSYSD